MRNLSILLAAITGLSLTVPVQAEETELCSMLLKRFMGLQRHVEKEGPTEVPQFQVGLKEAQIQAIIDEKGPCAAWQALQLSLQKQHGGILDATEEKTGKPSPVR